MSKPTWLKRRYVGKPIPPYESTKAIIGKNQYIDDVKEEGVLHLSVLRSPYARARIVKIDASDAMQRAKLVLLPSDHQYL